jgi:hypothetical protein
MENLKDLKVLKDLNFLFLNSFDFCFSAFPAFSDLSLISGRRETAEFKIGPARERKDE